MKLLTSYKNKYSSISTKSNILDYNVSLDWIYGIKLQNIKKPIQYLNTGQSQLLPEVIINNQPSFNQNEIYYYLNGKVVILYYKEQNKQYFYTNHQNEVISVCSSHKNERICASAEACIKPEIHIWSQESLQTIKILKGIHQDGIHLLSFACNSRFLLSVGQRDPSSVIVFDWVIGVNVLSVLLNFVGQDICCFETGSYMETSYLHENMIIQNSKHYNFTNNVNNSNNIMENVDRIQNDRGELNNNNSKIKTSSSVIAVVTNEELYCFYFNKSGVTLFEFEVDPEVIESDFLSVVIVPSESNIKINNNFTDDNEELKDYNKAEIVKFNENNYGNVVSSNLPYASIYEKNQFNIITGHMDGSLIKWAPISGHMITILKKYSFPIPSLSYFNKGCVVPQPNGIIYIWDKQTLNEALELDITYSINLVSNKVISVSTNSNRNKIIICFISGEVIEVKFDSKTPEIIKLNKIFLIDNINTLVLTNESKPHILFGGSNKLFSVIDSEMNEIVYLNYINYEITAIDSVISQNEEINIVLGTENGLVFLIKNWEDFPNQIKEQFYSRINDIKFSYDETLIIICAGNSVSLLFLEDNQQYMVSKRFELSDSEPLSIGLNDKYNLMMIITNNNKLFEINLKDYSIYDVYSKGNAALNNDNENKKASSLNNNEIINIENLFSRIANTNWQSFEIKFPINTKSKSILSYTTIFGNNIPIVISSFELNSFHIWKDFYCIDENTSELFRIHSSHIQSAKLSIDDSLLFTGGFNDRMICKFQINKVLNDESAIWPAFNDNFKNKTEIIINDPMIISELRYSEPNRSFEDVLNSQNRQQISALQEATNISNMMNLNSNNSIIDDNIIVKGFTNKLLTTLFSKKTKKVLHNMNIDQINHNNLGEMPQAFLELDYIFASHIGEKRDSVAYLHFSRNYDGEIINNKMITSNNYIHKNNFFLKEQEAIIRKVLNEDFENKSINEILQALNFAKLREEIAHYRCEKNILYFHSRIAIIYEPNTKIQTFYQGHRKRISCFAIDSYNCVIATGEATIFPAIHIWKPTGHTIKVIQTSHLNGIKLLKFSSRGKYLLSIDAENTIQLYLNNETVAFKVTGKLPILNAKFMFCDYYSGQTLKENLTYNSNNNNLYNINNYLSVYGSESSKMIESRFITVGYRNIIIWELVGNNLIKIKHVESQEFRANETIKSFDLKIFTCFDFLDYILNDKIESDVLIGSNFGDISAITCNKYAVLKTNLHEGGINCLKVTDLIQEKKYVVITAGEDGLIKIFDQSLNLMNTIDPYVFSKILLNQNFNRKFKGIIALDIHLCTPGVINLLIGFRCGDLIELNFSEKEHFLIPLNSINNISKNDNNSFSGNEEEIKAVQLYSYPYNINYKTKRNNNINLLFVCHKKLPIVIFTGNDKSIRFFDFSSNKNVVTKDLGHNASSIAMTNDSKVLALGMTNGLVALFDAYINIDNKSGKYNAPSLKTLQLISTYFTKVLFLRFSQDADFLAISYDNYPKGDKSGKTGGSILSLYMLRISKILPQVNIRTVTNELYVKVQDIELPESQFYSTKMNQKECAITNIDFSDNSLMILLSINKTTSLFEDSYNHYNNEYKNDLTLFVVWDIKIGHLTIDPEVLAKVNFTIITMATSVYAKNLSSYFSNISKNERDNMEINNLNTQINLVSKNTQMTMQQDSHVKSSLINLSVMNQNKPTSNFFIVGNTNGLLHIFRKKALEFDLADVPLFDIEKVRNNEMLNSRTFTAHNSRVMALSVSMDSNYIFTSAVFDQSIMKFRIIEEDIFSDLDFFSLSLTKDPFLDIMSKTEYVIATEEYWPLRDTIRDVYMHLQEKKSFHNNNTTSNEFNKDSFDQSDLELELAYVLGRKAIDRRNNLKYDENNRLVYTTSSYVLFLKPIHTENYDKTEVKEEITNKRLFSNYILKQEKLLPVENFDFNIQRELSCFALSNNKKKLALGHIGNKASVSVWEINTEVMIANIDMNFASIINLLKFSFNEEKIIGTALHKFYYNIVFIIDVFTSKIQSVCLNLNSLPFKIKDIEFLTNSIDNFVTVGIQHFSIWRVRGNNLEYSNIPVPQYNTDDEHYFDNNNESNNLAGKNQVKDNVFNNDYSKFNYEDLFNKEKEVLNKNHDMDNNELFNNNKFGICLLENKETIYEYAKAHDCENPEDKIKISFLGVVIFENSIISSTDSGYLYIFSFEKKFFSFRIKTHNSPIMSIDVSLSSYLIMSGAMDGTAILYGVILNKRLSVTSLQKLMVFNTFNNVNIPLRERLINSNYNIQSVSIGMNKVCIGTRSGNIFEFTISEDLKIILNKNIINKDNMLSNKETNNNKDFNNLETYIKFQDHDVPISLDFDIYSTRVFTVTKQGNFRVWSLINFHVDFEYDFKNKAIQSYHFRSQNVILLIFDYQIVAIDTNQKDMNIIPQYKRISAFEIQIGQILEVKISPNEKILAVSLLMNGNPCIYIYDILNGFVLKNILDKFDSYIRSIDFSVDSNYLIIEDNIGNTFHFEIQTRRHVTLDELNFEIEWMNDGLKYSDHFRCLPNVFGSDMMRITKISKHPNGKVVAVGDYTGVLRLFIYPAEEFDSYFTCRTDHTAKISHISWSNDMKYLATLSEQDRTVFIYRIV